jgi:DNA repair protein RecN (Recombination protein N)
MLSHLHVQNFALIEDLKLDLKSGLNIITGETGAGKSIILGALGLLGGKRADLSIIRKGANKCIVEGEFSLESYGLEAFFNSNDLDFEEPTIVRREISISGKSRAFINDTPVKLAILKEIGDRIIDVHSQNSNSILAKYEFAFSLLDNFGGNKEALLNYENLFIDYVQKKAELKELKSKQEKEKLNLEFNQFQLNELFSSNLIGGEQEVLEKEFEIVSNAEEIKSNGSIVVNNICHSNASVDNLLQEANISLDRLSSFDDSYICLRDRLVSALIEIKDIAEDVQNKISGLSSDFSKVQKINDRLDVIYSLQKKYNVSSVEQLIEKREGIQKLVDLAVGDYEGLSSLTKEIEICESILLDKANKLSGLRKKDAPKIADEIIKDLKLLGIKDAQLEFEFSVTELNKLGTDDIAFLFSANKGNDLQKVTKIASGGELSRLMLSVKRIIGTKTALPTIVFDEIDTGVSGEVANQMGRLMKEMGEKIQVITITHLPQIAAKGNAHFKVFKSNTNEETTTQIKQLTNHSRIDEVAQMLSGSNISDSARQNALELINEL